MTSLSQATGEGTLTSVGAFDSEIALEQQALEQTWRRPRGIVAWISSTDHKEIGLRFIITALCMFLFAGLLALGMRTQLARPLNNVLSTDLYNQFFTTHGTTMMFLFAVPIMQAMGIYLVPLMLGARNVAFPRLLNYAYWTYFAACALMVIGLLSNTGPDMGWFAYAPLSGPQFTPGHRADVWSQVVTLSEISSLAVASILVTTILKLRAPGMSLNRVPLFVWAQLITAFMVIFAMPAVTLGSTMITMDRLPHIGTQFYNPAEGGDALLWQHMFWFFAHPEVYIVFIPATGFVSSIIPVFCRRKMFGYTAIVLSMIATAFIGFGVWVHHMFVTPLPELGQGLFTASSMLIAIPTGVQIFCWIATMWGGKPPRLSVPFVFILGFIAIFVVGGLSGIMVASIPFDSQAHDTFFIVAHLHYVLIGGGIFPLFGALYYWFPKWTGRMLNSTLGHINFWLFFIGFNLAFFPMHALGLHGMTRRIYTYVPETGWGAMNLTATIGAYIIGLSVLAFIVNVLISRRRGMQSGSDPWGADTLEWATTSPPPSYNFTRPPAVRSRAPMWEGVNEARIVTGLSTSHRETLVTTTLDAVPDHRYALAKESIFPFLMSVVTALAFIGGGVFRPVNAMIAAGITFLVMLGWFWSNSLEDSKALQESGAAESYA